MVMASCILKMMTCWKEHLFKDDVKAKDDLLKLMEAIMMGILKIMWLMDMAFMLERKDLGMKANGKIMCLMVLVKPLILMAQGM